jgi:thiol-disulfide isomerase/thioredoxin
MKASYSYLALFSLSSLLLLGCAEQTVAPKVGDVADYNRLIASNKGKVVIVDFWATWCPPCVDNFPHTVGMANKYRDQGVAMISVSLDDPDDFAKVNRFLVGQRATFFPTIISKDGGGSASVDAFELDESVPHYRLYDRQGKLRYKWNGTPDDLEEKIQELLAESL